MSRPNKKITIPSEPLYTISEKPGKEDSSFIVGDDEHQTYTSSMPISSEIEPTSNPEVSQPIFSDPKKKKTENITHQVLKSRAENKKKVQSETDPKINITNESFDVDFKLVSEAFDEHLKESLPKWQQEENLTEDELNIIKAILEETKKEAFEKVIYNVEIVGNKSSKEQIVPIEVSLSRNVYRINEMNLENLKYAFDRVVQEKPHKEEITMKPEIPEDSEIEVIMEDGSIIMLNEYIRLQATKNLDNQTKEFEEYEKFVLKTQKNFIECIGMYDRINNELAEELRVLDQGKKKGNLLRFK